MEESGSTSNSSHSSQNQGGVFDHYAPLVAFTSHGQASILKVFSLNANKTVHVWRFGSAIIKFLTNKE